MQGGTNSLCKKQPKPGRKCIQTCFETRQKKHVLKKKIKNRIFYFELFTAKN